MPAKKYLLHFAVAHEDFRLPELSSVSQLFNFEIGLPDDAKEYDPRRPFTIVALECDKHARLLARRCTMIKAVYELWADTPTYDAIHIKNKENQAIWAAYKSATFKFNVTAMYHTIPETRQKCIIEEFSYMAYEGAIDLKRPEVALQYFEEYPVKSMSRTKEEGDGEFLHCYFGRLIEEGSARPLINKFDVKQRTYYGNTSMDAEISLLMANQALASPGKLIYDPFVGTGSMLYTAAHYGALVFGSDIDGRQMRGKAALNTPGILCSAEQYGVANRILDLCTFDITASPLRRGGIFDAIVTDPPYGVRAGAKRLGKKDAQKRQKPDTSASKSTDERIPKSFYYPTKPYELSELASDLVLLARYLLKPGGRLVFFLPTVTEEYQEVDIPICAGMDVVANSVQDFGKWARRLITICKTSDDDFPAPTFEATQRMAELAAAPSNAGHRDFREKYFAKFSVERYKKNIEALYQAS